MVTQDGDARDCDFHFREETEGQSGKAFPEVPQPVRGGARTSLVVQWLRLRTSTAWGTGSIPGQGTKIPHARLGQK